MIFLAVSFCSQVQGGSALRPRFFTSCTIFGRVFYFVYNIWQGFYFVYNIWQGFLLRVQYLAGFLLRVQYLAGFFTSCTICIWQGFLLRVQYLAGFLRLSKIHFYLNYIEVHWEAFPITFCEKASYILRYFCHLVPGV